MKNSELRTPNSELIRCEGVWKVYNEAKPYEVRALEDLNLSIGKGSFTALKGPSGSGKTTLISIIGCIDRQTRGRVFLDNRDTTGLSDVALSRLRRQRIGFVFQNFNLISGLSAWENVSAPLIPMGFSEKDRRERAVGLLKKLGLSDRSSHFPEELSGGEQQRVAVARALVNIPDIIILDEPTSNIDAENIEILMGILSGLKQEGKTILISSHDDVVLRNADMVYNLKWGRVVEQNK